MRSGAWAGVLLGASLFAVRCAATRAVTVVQDVTVTFDGESDRSPLRGPSARLSAAASEVKALLGHPLSIVLDANIVSPYGDSFDDALTHTFEELAARLVAVKKEDGGELRALQAHLHRLTVRYAPAAERHERVPRLDGEDGVVVTLGAHWEELVPVADVLWVLRGELHRVQAERFAQIDPGAVPAADQPAYVRWLSGDLNLPSAARDPRDPLDRLTLALRFSGSVQDRTLREQLTQFLTRSATPDLVARSDDHDPRRAAVTEQLATWLESQYAAWSSEQRAEVLDALLARWVKDARLLECGYRLAERSVDAWRAAGHPLPRLGSNLVPREFQLALCMHPKDDNDARSLAPNCARGIVGVALAAEGGTEKLGQLMASRKDPVLAEHVLADVVHGSYREKPLAMIHLIRAIEADPALLEVALRVVAEDDERRADLDLWSTELRRLWSARPLARGSILYALANQARYADDKIDFADFQNDFGSRVSADELRAYLDEGYRALALAWLVWPALAPNFAREPLLRPHLEQYVDDRRIHALAVGSSYQPLNDLRFRLCDERKTADLRALSRDMAELLRTHPGQGLADMVNFFDPRACESCSGLRDSPCARSHRRSVGHSFSR